MAASKRYLFFLCVLVATTTALAQGRHTKGEKPLSVAQGQSIKLEDFLVTGRTTVFMFTSEYSAICRSYNEPLYLLHRQFDGVAIVKVDINRPEYHHIDWASPVAQQYDVKSLPRFRIYTPDGKLHSDGQTALDVVNRWLETHAP